MSEKVTSMRLNEDDLEQFKEFAKENGLNQQQAFNSLLNMVKLENAKEKLGDRSKSIETFKDTINRAIGMYINSLEENVVAEDRIREELSKELNTKDNTISNLQEQLQKVKADYISLEEKGEHLSEVKEVSEKEVKRLEKDILEKTNNLDIANRNNNNLQDQLAEYKMYKDNYKVLKDELDKLKEDNVNLINDNKQLNDKLINYKDMLEFYKNQIEQQHQDIKSLNISMENKEIASNAHIEALDAKYKEQVSNVKDLYKSTLEFELQKKQLEIEKLSKNKTKASASKTK